VGDVVGPEDGLQCPAERGDAECDLYGNVELTLEQATAPPGERPGGEQHPGDDQVAGPSERGNARSLRRCWEDAPPHDGSHEEPCREGDGDDPQRGPNPAAEGERSHQHGAGQYESGRELDVAGSFVTARAERDEAQLRGNMEQLKRGDHGQRQGQKDRVVVSDEPAQVARHLEYARGCHRVDQYPGEVERRRRENHDCGKHHQAGGDGQDVAAGDRGAAGWSHRLKPTSP
jgi:hypothetical protein